MGLEVEVVVHKDLLVLCKDPWICTDHHKDQVVVDVCQMDLVWKVWMHGSHNNIKFEFETNVYTRWYLPAVPAHHISGGHQQKSAVFDKQL